MKKTFFILFIFFFFTPKYTLAEISCPNFEFTKNFQKGDIDEEVYVLQQILNLDKRTLVAQTGPGSSGKETAFFGVATRESLKRFQALFIEYIEVADGKFNTKTRTVMNNVCQSPYFTNGTGNIFDTATNTDTFSPIVGISGPENIETLDPFRVYLGANEAIKTPSLVGLIIENATAGDIRKTSSTTFSFLVTPNADASGQIVLQFEADSIEDLAGNKNEVASNEWIIIISAVNVGTTTTDLSLLDDILNSIPTASTSDCSQVGGVNVYDYSNPCYGKAPMTGGQGETPQQKKDSGMMQMLQGLMQGLVQALSGMKPAGGSLGADSACGCTGMPTVGFSAKKGVSGRQTNFIKIGRSSDEFVGEQGPPPGVCGVRFKSGKKDTCPGIPGPHNSNCCGILLDKTMQPVTGMLKN